MALRFFKSFYESLSNDKDVLKTQSPSIITTPYGRGLSFPGDHGYGNLVLLDALGGAGVALQDLGPDEIFLGMYTMGGIVTLGGVTLVNFSTNGASTTINGKIVGAGWHWMEIRLVRIPGTTVTYTRQVRLDGEEYYNDAPNLASVWTQNPLQLLLGNVSNPNQSTYTTQTAGSFSPPVVWDSIDDGSIMKTWMGPMLVDVLRPAASGAKSEWLGSDGDSVDNYALVDETPVSTVDYVESSTDGQRDLYTHGGMPDGYTPLGIRQVVYAQKNGANLKSMKLVISQPNGDGTFTDTVGTEEVLNDTARFISSDVFGKNPRTGLPWTAAEINELQFGVESSTPVQ